MASYASTMIAATKGDQLACVDVIGDRTYIVGVYASTAARNSATVSSTLTLRGTPNAVDILAALPAGFTASPDLPTARSVPPTVSARQIRLVLISRGISLAAVDAAIAAIPDAAQRDAVRVEWEYAPYVERSHPMLVPLAAALGMSEADVDNAFREAEQL